MYALSTTRTSQPGNYLDLCGVSIPLPRGSGELPVGLQLMGVGGSDAQLLAVAVAVEQALGAR